MLKTYSISLLRSLYLMVAVLVVCICNAQEIYRLPVVNSFSQQPIFHNPAHKSLGEWKFNGNFHSYMGDFSDINYTYLSAVKNYNKYESGAGVVNKRSFGGMFFHDRTGDFIKQSRLYFIYQESVNLSKKFWIRAGAQIGGVNIIHSSLGFGPGGSAWNYDGAMAINFGNDELSAGFIMQQITNSELTPIIYSYRLQRYNELFINYKFELGPYVSYTPELRYQQGANQDYYLLSNTIDYQEIAGANLTWFMDRGFSVLGYYNIYSYQVFASYFLPLASNLKEINAMQYELGLTALIIKSGPPPNPTNW